ncbi:MAG: helical backbone metal receptor [Planctomycetota bacterium]|nr:helical backbone metal receptor [Planctomycetota bacterium]
MRLVSLCPSLTETVFDLGRGEDLVGRTRYCVLPQPQAQAVEDVGGTKSPNVARILELAPDLVLLNEEENRRGDHEALVAAGVRCHTSFPRAPADIPPLLRELGGLIGSPGAGERLAREVEAARAALTMPPSAVSFVYLIWRKPWMGADRTTFASGLLEAAGGANALGRAAARYPALTLAELAVLDPARVLLSSEPFPFARKHLAELSAGSGLPADRFRLVDGQLLSWHGSRTRLGLPYAATCLA